MDSSVSPKDEIWFMRVCHHISTGLYQRQSLFCLLPSTFRRVTGHYKLIVLYWVIFKSMCFLYSRFKPLHTEWKMLTGFRKSITFFFLNIVNLRSYVLLVRATCKWRCVWSTGGKILTGKCSPEISRGLTWDRIWSPRAEAAWIMCKENSRKQYCLGTASVV